MSSGIEKETFVEADEKTTKALTFDLIEHQTQILEHLKICHAEHMTACDNRFKLIENQRAAERVKDCEGRIVALEGRQKKDRALSAASGFGGGFMAVLTLWFTGLFGGKH